MQRHARALAALAVGLGVPAQRGGRRMGGRAVVGSAAGPRRVLRQRRAAALRRRRPRKPGGSGSGARGTAPRPRPGGTRRGRAPRTGGRVVDDAQPRRGCGSTGATASWREVTSGSRRERSTSRWRAAVSARAARRAASAPRPGGPPHSSASRPTTRATPSRPYHRCRTRGCGAPEPHALSAGGPGARLGKPLRDRAGRQAGRGRGAEHAGGTSPSSGTANWEAATGGRGGGIWPDPHRGRPAAVAPPARPRPGGAAAPGSRSPARGGSSPHGWRGR